MSYSIERKIIESRLQTLLAVDRPDLPIDFENIEFEQPDQEPWIRAVIVSGDSFPASLGSPAIDTRYRHIGRLVVQIFTMAGTGNDEAKSIADDIAAIFRGETVIQESQQIVFFAPEILQGESEAGWFRLTVSVPFQRDEFY